MGVLWRAFEDEEEFNLSTEFGYWKNITATLDWCEENYAVSIYVAEFWNSISNLLMIILPAIHLWRLMLKKYRTPPNSLESWRACMPYFSLLTVGIGSSLFHLTLKVEGQLVDEISMIFCSVPSIINLLTYDHEKWKKKPPIINPGRRRRIPSNFRKTNSPKFNINELLNRVETFLDKHEIETCLIIAYSYAIGSTILYWKYFNPIVQEISYGIMVLFGLYQSLIIMHRYYRWPLNDINFFHSKDNSTNRLSEQFVSKVNSHIRYLYKLLISSLVIYSLGFILWNVENFYCAELRSMRKDNHRTQLLNSEKTFQFSSINFIELLTQLHGWWHIFAGLGTYIFIQFTLEVRKIFLFIRYSPTSTILKKID
ncbi:hypothetical protein SNEBB_004644 [Seison nebaliae]|nr:hypothetical protein SNEBB_004644 [Seison nebaliae]